MRSTLFLILISFHFGCLSHNFETQTKIDSLLEITKTSNQDTVIANAHLELVYLLYDTDQEKANRHLQEFTLFKDRAPRELHASFEIKLIEFRVKSKQADADKQLIAFSNSVKVQEKSAQLAKVHQSIAELYDRLGKLKQASEHYKLAIELNISFNQKRLLAENYTALGLIQKNIGNYKEALSLNLKAIEVWKLLPNSITGIAQNLVNLGIIYKQQKDYNKGLEFANKALSLYRQLPEGVERDKGMANCYNNLGVLYKLDKRYDKALNEYYKSLELHRKNGSLKHEASVLHNVGNVFMHMGQFEKAEEFIKKSLSIKYKLSSSYHIATSEDLLAELYLANKQYTEAAEHGEIALRLAKESGSANLLLDIHETLTEIYAITNNRDLFMSNWKAYKTISDTLFSANKTKMVYQLQARYDLEKEEEIQASKLREAATKKREQATKEKYEDALAERDKIRQWIQWSTIILLLALAISLYSRFRSAKRSRQELQHANEELKRTLLSKEEKEVLIREIHHRVKNNMQIIMSLLRLQASNITDDHIQSLYSESQNRIKSMALVHEELYQTKDLTDVSVKNYLEKLIDNLILNYSLKTKIVTKSDIKITKLGIDTLIPLGLLLNEIISNSFKHGFKDMEQGEIYVHLKRLDASHKLELKIGDNGEGLQKDPKASESLGYELIEALVEQLDGSLKMYNENGVHYQITFQEQEK